MSMPNLFTYGTLMCEEIMGEVSGCHLLFRSGRLRGFSRRQIKGESYPAIFPNDKDTVLGIVYLDVPRRAWLRLDNFEGELYLRQSVPVESSCGTILRAETYVIRPALQDLLDVIDWNYETFLRHGKEAFRKHYRGYRAI